MWVALLSYVVCWEYASGGGLMINIYRERRTTRRKIQPLEDDECFTFIEWCELHEKRWPCLKWLFHVDNEGKHKVQYRVKRARKGVKGGVSDYMLLVPRKGYNGLIIEMKRIGGYATPVQKDFLNFEAENGYYVCVCSGANQAIKALKFYLS